MDVLKNLACALLLLPMLGLPRFSACAQQDIPHLEKKDDRFALVIDGKPFLMLVRRSAIQAHGLFPCPTPGPLSKPCM